MAIALRADLIHRSISLGRLALQTIVGDGCYLYALQEDFECDGGSPAFILQFQENLRPARYQSVLIGAVSAVRKASSSSRLKELGQYHISKSDVFHCFEPLLSSNRNLSVAKWRNLESGIRANFKEHNIPGMYFESCLS